MDKRLEGKVGIVTGAGQTAGQTTGNGRATALLFARHGARLVICDRDSASLEETAGMIRNEGGEVVTLIADVSNAGDCEKLATTALASWGKLDILHNNVGIGFRDGSVTRLEEADWDRIMDVNLKSMYLTCKHAIPAMRETGGGSIINISSVAAIASTAMLAYKTSKAGVMALTQHVAMGNAAHNIRANCILPGLMNTPMAVEGYSATLGKSREDVISQRDAMVPLGRKMGTSEDVAYAALFLASDESKFITGVNLPVDGGQSIKIG